MKWRIGLDDQYKVVGFYPPFYNGVYPKNVIEIDEAQKNTLYRAVQQHDMKYDKETSVFIEITPVGPTFKDFKEWKKATIAAARYEAEVAGIAVNGVSIATDRDSQALLTSAVVSAMLDENYSVEWKQPDGTFISLNAAQIIELGKAVRAHVETCFNREKELYAEIAAAQTAEEVEQIKWGAE